MKPVYLDYNATTPIDPGVLEAMLPYLREHFGNPSSGHLYGIEAQTGVTQARRHGIQG
jgi:cysteine desulfurase